jgi:hypothetical protein
MIIWGSRGITHDEGGGQFYCPGCQSEQGYSKRRVQRYFTLYFIPLIPLETLGASVKCSNCRKEWVPEVLNHNPRLDQEAAHREITDYYGRVLCHFAIMAGRRDGDFVKQVVEMSGELDAAPISFEEVNRGLDRNNNPGPAVAHLARWLNERGREIVVKNALAAATADGSLTEEKRAAVSDLAQKLGMSDTHLVGVLASWAPSAGLQHQA